MLGLVRFPCPILDAQGIRASYDIGYSAGLDGQFGLTESLLHVLEKVVMFTKVSSTHNNVIQIHGNSIPRQSSHDVSHRTGETAGTFLTPKGMTRKLPVARFSGKGTFLSAPLFNWDLPITAIQIKGCKEAGPL